ncbi:MAG: ArdC family protein [Burkholderiaceae bacterium]|nr:ArdC family protein [Burkholderiaceae bacterium]
MAFMNAGKNTNESSQKTLPEISEAVQKARVEMTDRLVDQAAKGIAPWNHKLDPNLGERLPYNPFSKTKEHDALRGANGLQLASVAEDKGYKDPRWISRSQMQERGWSFKTGEKGTNVEFYSPKGTERTQYKRDDQGNEVFDEDGNRMKETVVLEKSTIGAIQMFNLEQVVEGKFAKTPIPELDKAARQPALKELNETFAKSGIEVRDAMSGAPSHIGVQGKGAIYLSEPDKGNDVAKAQLMVRGMAAKALTLDTAGGWSRADSDRTKFIKTELRIELASRLLSDKYAIPNQTERLDDLKGHVAQTLDEINGKTREKDQIRFAARDADRAVTRVLDGNWSRSQEWSRNQNREQQPERSQQEQPEHPQEVKAPAKSRSKGKALERG